MVDIVQSNYTKLLIRKIGYSVGLESTLDRINILVDEYIHQRQLTNVSWRDIVETKYGRKENSGKHFENLFGVLGVIEVSAGRPIPLYLLDVLALLKRFYKDDIKKYDQASRVIFLYSVTIADGELLAALLGTNFNRSLYVDALSKYRQEKLELYYNVYKNNSLKSKLYRIINFEEIAQNTTTNTQMNSLRGATPPFMAGGGTTSKEDINNFTVRLSDDWYKKVPRNRQSWSEDLNLYKDGEITIYGERYLEALRSLIPRKYRNGNSVNSVIIMPLDIEMLANNVTWSLDNDMLVKFDDLLVKLCNVYTSNNDSSKQLNSNQLIEDILPFVFHEYVKADVRFTKIRRELPYTILALFCLGYCVTEGLMINSAQEVLINDLRNKINYQLRSSRNSIWGITLKSH